MQNSATERSFQPRKAGKVSESHKVTQGIREIFIKAFERQKTPNDIIYFGPTRGSFEYEKRRHHVAGTRILFFAFCSEGFFFGVLC